MTRAATTAPHHGEAPFRDGLGERRPLTDAAGQSRELLCLRPDLTVVPAFEFALRERVARLAEFRHPAFVPVRSVERLTEVGSTLGVVSDAVSGLRLVRLFTQAAERGLNLDVNVALSLTRQLLDAMAALHAAYGDVAHGALAPERVVLTPQGRLLVADYGLGAALAQLRYSQERYWKELQVALPRAAGLPRIEASSDVVQVGVVALALILGRSLRAEDYPTRLADIVRSAQAIAPRGGFEPVPAGLRQWFARVLRIDAEQGMPTIAAARDAFEEAVREWGLPESSRTTGTPGGVEGFFARVHAAEAETVVPIDFEDPLAQFQPERTLETAKPKARGSSEAMLADFPREASSQAAPVEAVRLPSPSVVSGTTPLKAAAALRAPSVAPATASSAPARAPRPLPTPVKPPVRPVAGPERDLFAGHAAGQSRGWGVALAASLVAAVLAGMAPAVRWARTARQAGTVAPPAAMGDRSPASTTGTFVVTTHPAGAEVWLDGQTLGTTPLTATADAGSHSLELKRGDHTRTLPLSITAGGRTEQYIELPDVPVAPLVDAAHPAGR